MLRLSTETISLIRSKQSLPGILAEHLSVHASTINRWLSAGSNGDIMLTTADALEVISKELGIPKKELLTRVNNHELHLTNPIK
jgi:hypothetical protein